MWAPGAGPEGRGERGRGERGGAWGPSVSHPVPRRAKLELKVPKRRPLAAQTHAHHREATTACPLPRRAHAVPAGRLSCLVPSSFAMFPRSFPLPGLLRDETSVAWGRPSPLTSAREASCHLGGRLRQAGGSDRASDVLPNSRPWWAPRGIPGPPPPPPGRAGGGGDGFHCLPPSPRPRLSAHTRVGCSRSAAGSSL